MNERTTIDPGIRGRGDPYKTYYWGSILTLFNKDHVLIFAHQNRVRSMFLEFLEIVKGGGTPLKRISEGLF